MYTETDHPWAASAVEAASGLLAAPHGKLQKLPIGSHLCTGSPRMKSLLTHGQLLIIHRQPLTLPKGSMNFSLVMLLHTMDNQFPCQYSESTFMTPAADLYLPPNPGPHQMGGGQIFATSGGGGSGGGRIFG